MKKSARIICAVLALAAGPVFGQAAPSCGAILCLSPAPGQPPPSECFGWRGPYFAIRIYDPYTGFNAPATAAARQVYLQTCTQARPMDIARITKTYGYLEFDPMTY